MNDKKTDDLARAHSEDGPEGLRFPQADEDVEGHLRAPRVTEDGPEGLRAPRIDEGPEGYRRTM